MVAAPLHYTADPARWLRARRRVPSPRVRLVCLPYAGGACTTFHAWPDRLPLDVEVIAVQPPGRQERMAETPLTRVAALADAIVAALDALPPAPTALFGHSLGGCVAYEVARRMRAAGEPPVCMVIGAASAPHLARPATPIHALPEPALLDALHRRYATPWELLGDAELMAMTLPALRADLEALETYEYAPDPALAVPVTVLRGALDARVPPEGAAAWAKVTRGAVTVHEIDAGHFFVDSHRDWVLAHVRRALLT